VDGVAREEALELLVELGRQRLVCDRTSAGLPISWITLAMEKVLPVPVAPIKVCVRLPSRSPATSFSMAGG
jgi:hypothetical protein